MLVECLLAVRPLDIPNVVKGLSAEECDGVIKAVYGGWKAGRVDNGLLAWFEKVGFQFQAFISFGRNSGRPEQRSRVTALGIAWTYQNPALWLSVTLFLLCDN